MALTYAEKLVELGMPPEQAKVLIAAVTAGTPDFDAAVAASLSKSGAKAAIAAALSDPAAETAINAAVAAKTQIAALDNQSVASDIVDALQA